MLYIHHQLLINNNQTEVIKMKAQRTDAYQVITDKIIAALEAGTSPWSKSWGPTGGTPLRSNGKPYQGINVWLLALSGHGGRHWFTYNQAKELGAQVRGGETGTQIVFFKPLKVEDKVTGTEKTIPLIRLYTVFNQCQIDGLPAKFDAPEAVRNAEERDAAAQAFFDAVGFDTRHGGDRAFYIPSKDYVQMPAFEAFDDAEAYYATLAHEYAHMTGHEDRLDRNLKQDNGTKDHAKEELVAEMGAAFICGALGLSAEPREDHASYLASWLRVLKADNKAIVKAASAAQKAADFVLNAGGEALLEQVA
jgi:antirestriction protein ArdC